MKTMILIPFILLSTAALAAEKPKKAAPPKPAEASAPAEAPAETPAAVEPPAQPAETPAAQPEGHDSTMRWLFNFAAGTLQAKSYDKNNAIEQDYDTRMGAGLGLLGDYRPAPYFGLEFGVKLLAVAAESKTTDVTLNLNYLAIPLEGRIRIMPLMQRSQLFAKAGVSWLHLLKAKVEQNKRDKDKRGWDWDDAYPSPPTPGSYKDSFNKDVYMATVGIGADFLLFQTGNGFNMSLIPDITYNRSINSISKSGEFNGSVYLEGYMTGISLAAGF